MPPPRLKILLVGDEGCGKTCLIRRFVEGAFAPRCAPTVGVDFGVHPIPLPGGGGVVRANLYDLSGAPQYALVRAEFYREADALVLVCDARDAGALAGAGGWLAEAVAGGLRAGVPVLLCCTRAEGGGPAGAPRALPAAAGAAWAQAQLGARERFLEASALTGEGVAEVMAAAAAAAATALEGAAAAR
jgi:hypothetical protein